VRRAALAALRLEAVAIGWEDTSMKSSMMSKIVFSVIALALPLSAASVAIAKAHKAKPHHAHHHKGKSKACKGEFMYKKGGKCLDSRKKK
jgi:hypothetical protein